MSLFRDKARASTMSGGAVAKPVGASGKGAKQRFHVGDEVTVTGGTGSTTLAHGTDTTFIVRSATLTPTGWQYDLGTGAPMPQGALHMVEPASSREAPATVVAKPITVKPATSKKPAPVAPTQGGPKMTQRQQRITDLLGLVKAEKDAARLGVLKAELVKLAQEESAAIKAVPAAPQPTYPIGMEASFGGKWVKILKAWQTSAGGPWTYQVDAKLGMLFNVGNGTHTQTEAEIRSRLADALGSMGQGQAFPRGIVIYRNGQGGQVVAVSSPGASGEWGYSIQGWPNPVSQSELQAILRRA
jgi:hypothetical protein